MINVHELTKVYGDGTRAVDGVSFEVTEGEMYGFLGPNGAGKTTVIRILVTLLGPSSGTASVAGYDVERFPECVRRMFGYAAQFVAIDRDLTARENLIISARLQGMTSARARQRADELLERFSLSSAANRKAGVLSGGTRRRLDLAQALVHEPPLVFLDEPTTGLDPENRHALWSYLREINGAGCTVFLTTQYLEEADRLCERIAIVDRGRVAVIGSPAELKAQIGVEVVTIQLDDRNDTATLARAAAAIDGLPGVSRTATPSNGELGLALNDAGSRLSDLIRALDSTGVKVSSLSMSRPTLDEVFLKYTGMRIANTDGRQSAEAIRG